MMIAGRNLYRSAARRTPSVLQTMQDRIPNRQDHCRWNSTEDNMSASLFKNPIVHQLWTARQQAKENKLNSNVALDRCTISKRPLDSRVEITYPFSTDPLLWETYKSPWDQMRFGKVLEDLDALAGNIAFFHVNDATTEAPDKFPVIVTASVDRIRVGGKRPDGNTDQLLSGQVTWTGSSSMEIRMIMTSSSETEPWLEAFVTFVTLDPHTHKPLRIPQLVPSTPEEQTLFDHGAARAAVKKQRRKQRKDCNNDPVAAASARSLLDQAAAHRLMPCLVADRRAVLVHETKMENAMIAQPQVQNLHHRVFGGFLMRRAFELGFANAYVFGGSRPVFVEVDEVSFVAPVDVGDLVVLHSRVLYTSTSKSSNKTHVHIEVEAWVTTPEEVKAKRSNQFYFTFEVDDGEAKCCTVLPSNMDEALRIVERIQNDEEQDQQHH